TPPSLPPLQPSHAGTPPEPAKPKSASPALSLQKVRAAWQSIRGKVEGERQSLRAPLSRAAIESVEENVIVLKLPDAWSADALRDHARIIEAAIADVLGVTLSVRLRVDGSAGRSKGSAPGNVASMTGARREEDDPDALFDYANERIR
ncbi:MAG: hypothetical protein WCB99_15210, partial [Candidatus Cybelea sp.]